MVEIFMPNENIEEDSQKPIRKQRERKDKKEEKPLIYEDLIDTGVKCRYCGHEWNYKPTPIHGGRPLYGNIPLQPKCPACGKRPPAASKREHAKYQCPHCGWACKPQIRVVIDKFTKSELEPKTLIWICETCKKGYKVHKTEGQK